MKTRYWFLSPALLLAGCAGLTQNNIDTPRLLSANEVRALFVGKTARSYNLGNKVSTWSYYREDGALLQERFWASRNGHWEIQSDGQICLKVKRRSCRFIGQVGDRYYKYRHNAQGELEAIIRYSDFTQGNPLGL